MEYYANKEGDIFNIHGYKLKQTKHSKGYLTFTEYLGGNKKRKQWFSHRFIWIYHNGPIPEGFEINHINHIKTDNRLSNLELVTPKENNRHRPYCTLNAKLAEEIRDKYSQGNTTMSKLAEEYGCGKTTIYYVLNYITWND